MTRLCIHLRTITEQRLKVDVNTNTSVAEFQRMVSKLVGCPPDVHLLSKKGEMPQDLADRTLDFYDLQDNDEVLLVHPFPAVPGHTAPAYTLTEKDLAYVAHCKARCRHAKTKKVNRCGKVNRTLRPLPPCPTCPPPALTSETVKASLADQIAEVKVVTQQNSIAAQPMASAHHQKAPQNRREGAVKEESSVDIFSKQKSETDITRMDSKIVEPRRRTDNAQEESKKVAASLVNSLKGKADSGTASAPSLQVKPPRKDEAVSSGRAVGSGTVAPGPPPPSKEAFPAMAATTTPSLANVPGLEPQAAAPRTIPHTPLAGSVNVPAMPRPQPVQPLSWSPPTTILPAVMPPNGTHATSQDRSPSGTPIQRIKRSDLQRIGRLGVGAFGVVTLEADKRTGRTYALKAVSKGYLAQLHMEYSVLNEKRILKMLESPFVVRLLATYNGREHVYFLLEAALGGELFTTYERLRLYGSVRHAQFYVACVAEALTHLHERHVIYRDLKPENLLLDQRGYCKLTDMGLAKITHSPTFTLVGTPDYMAPEVVNQSGHTKMVDWWMLGVLLFELLAGRAPFEAENTQQVYESVKRGIEQVRFPAEVRNPAADLVRQLCRHVPEQRTRTPTLQRHPFFRDFSWENLRAQRITPPHIPQVRGPRDLANFRQCDDEDPPATPWQDTGAGWDAGFEDDTLGAQTAGCRAIMGCIDAPQRTTPSASLNSSPRDVHMARGNVVTYSPRSNNEGAHFWPATKPATMAATAAGILHRPPPQTVKVGTSGQRGHASPPHSPGLTKGIGGA